MWSILSPKKVQLVEEDQALEGRSTSLFPEGETHMVLNRFFANHEANSPPGNGIERIIFGMGCFWGAERLFWQVKGVCFTSVGYAGGFTANPIYEEVCSGLTGHSEVVQVDYDPSQVKLTELLKLFWERHDPTQYMRQGNDIGTQYRSAIYWTNEDQAQEVKDSASAFKHLLEQGKAPEASSQEVHTELAPLKHYYYAELYHQQYLHKHPNGYCGLKGTGVSCTW